MRRELLPEVLRLFAMAELSCNKIRVNDRSSGSFNAPISLTIRDGPSSTGKICGQIRSRSNIHYSDVQVNEEEEMYLPT